VKKIDRGEIVGMKQEGDYKGNVMHAEMNDL